MSATIVMANGEIYKSAYLAATNVCVRPVIEMVGEKYYGINECHIG